MYNRITSYIYGYDNGEKQSNCGYFRFDLREKQCKLSISVRVPDKYTMGIAEIYLLKGSADGIKGVLLGKTGGLNGSICYKHMCTVDDIAEGVTFGEAFGILIYNGADLKRVFAGNIKDEEMDILSFAKEWDEENTVYEIDEECQEEWCRQIREENEQQQEAENTRDEEIQTENSEISEMQEQSGEEVVSMDLKAKPESWQEVLFSKFPKVRVGFDGEDCEAIKMRPHDLVWFPRRYWRICNNPCLLNGYDNYRYIMLVRGTGKREGSYYLAVPGKRRAGRQESRIFNEFVLSKGDFGYWCHRVGQS